MAVDFLSERIETTICRELVAKTKLEYYLTGEIQGKQTILEVFKCEESVQSLERFSI